MCCLLLLSSTVSAQSFEAEYEKALLDSAYRYELLKPAYQDLTDAHKNLKTAYEYKGKELESLQMSIVQSTKVHRKERRKCFWKGVKIGVGATMISCIALIIL